MRFGEPHPSPGKRFSYQTEHVGTAKLQRLIVQNTYFLKHEEITVQWLLFVPTAYHSVLLNSATVCTVFRIVLATTTIVLKSINRFGFVIKTQCLLWGQIWGFSFHEYQGMIQQESVHGVACHVFLCCMCPPIVWCLAISRSLMQRAISNAKWFTVSEFTI